MLIHRGPINTTKTLGIVVLHHVVDPQQLTTIQSSLFQHTLFLIKLSIKVSDLFPIVFNWFSSLDHLLKTEGWVELKCKLYWWEWWDTREWQPLSWVRDENEIGSNFMMGYWNFNNFYGQSHIFHIIYDWYLHYRKVLYHKIDIFNIFILFSCRSILIKIKSSRGCP